MAEHQSARDKALTPGDRLGPYEVISFLAAGGMGEIYVARDTRLDRQVAVKILPAAHGLDQDRLKRFEKEARAASRLSHPNILAVYDVGKTDNALPYIVTELLDGDTLRVLLHTSKPPVIDLAVQIIRGIAAAHDKGIIHRDLKPSNIFVTREGHVKLLDFGLAKLMQPEWRSAGQDDETLSGVSQPGVVLGSPGYMAPEQVRGAFVDERSDIFSFGVVLYEMLTSRQPFHRDSPAETISAILTAEPEPISRPDVSRSIIAIVDRCLQKQPENRFASARDVLFIIENLVAPDGVGTSITHRFLTTAGNAVRQRPRLSLGLAVLAAATVLGALYSKGAGSMNESEALDHESLIPYTSARIEKVTSLGTVQDLALSSDGVFLAYTSKASLRLRHIPSGSDIELIPQKEGQYLQTAGISSDGSFVYYRDANDTGHLGLARIPLMGGTPQRILDQHVSQISFSQDGSQFAAFREEASNGEAASQLIVAAADGSDVRTVVALTDGRELRGSPSWSSDGRRLVVSIAEPLVSPWGWVPNEIDVFSGAMRVIDPHCSAVSGVQTLHAIPAGGYLATPSDDQVWIVSADLERCRRLTDDPVTYNLAGWAAANASATRIPLLGTQEVSNIWEEPLTPGRSPKRLTFGINTRDSGAALLADGRLIFTRNDSGMPGGNDDMWLIDLAGEIRRLTNTPVDEEAPAPSPDGTFVVYVRAEKRTEAAGLTYARTLWRLDLGGGDPVRLETADDRPADPIVALDGAIYYTTVDSDNVPRLKRVSMDASDPVDVTRIGSCKRGLRVSPDGQRMSCGTVDGRIKAVSMDGRTLVDVEGPDRWTGLKWSHDSSRLNFLKQYPGRTEVWELSLEGSYRKIADIVPEHLTGYVVRPDGRSIIGSRGSTYTDAYVMTLE